MKRNIRTPLLILLAALLIALPIFLTGCASRSATDGNSVGGIPAPAPAEKPAPGYEEDRAGGELGKALPDIQAPQAPGSEFGEKLIYNADMNLETPDIADMIDKLTARISTAGGYASSSSMRGTDYATLTARVPIGEFPAFMEDAKGMAKLLSSNMSTQDVTSEYYDIDARLKNAQAQEAQLLEILKRAQTVEDTLLVRQELSRIQGDIEAFQGRLKLMDSLVAYSTVQITLTRPQTLVSEEEREYEIWSFQGVLKKVREGFVNTGKFLVNALYALLIGLSYLIIPAAIAVAVLLAVLWLIRLSKRRKQPK